MASSRATARGSQKARGPQWEISPSTKKAVIAGAAGVVVLVAGIWAFQVLTAPPKPDLKVAKVDKVCEFLGHPRGLARMPVEQREQFLVEVVQTYNTPERFDEMATALRQMSFTERQQLLDATFEIGKVKFVKAADEYAKTPKQDRAQFVDKVVRDFDNLRVRLGGGPIAGGAAAVNAAGVKPGPNSNLGGIFKDHIPTKSDAWAKMAVDRTTPGERAKMKPLADDLAQRLDQIHNDPRARADFAGRR